MKRKIKKIIYWLADPLIWMAVFVLFLIAYWKEQRS